jgi:hypothetical protein
MFGARSSNQASATCAGVALSRERNTSRRALLEHIDGKWTVHQKTLPSTGQTDNGEILKVDTSNLPAVLKTVTMTINVR